MMDRNDSLKRARHVSDRASTSCTRKPMAQLGSTAATVALSCTSWSCSDGEGLATSTTLVSAFVTSWVTWSEPAWLTIRLPDFLG